MNMVRKCTKVQKTRLNQEVASVRQSATLFLGMQITAQQSTFGIRQAINIFKGLENKFEDWENMQHCKKNLL